MIKRVKLWKNTLPGIPTFVFPNASIMHRHFLLLVILIICCSVCVSAQNKPEMNEPYTAQWRRADSLLNQGLPQSARAVVNKVYSEARGRNQGVQILKAQLYLLRIDAAGNENADSLS